MSETAAKTGLLLGLLAMFTDILTLALPWWTYREEEIFGEYWRSNHGLWEECNRITDIFGSTQNSCLKIQEPLDHVALARNMCIFGLLLVVGSMLTTCVGRWVKNDLKLVPLFGALIMMIAGILIWVGVLVFSAGYVTTAGTEPWDVHAAWYLGVFTAVLCFVSAILGLWDKMHTDNKDQPGIIQPAYDPQDQVNSSSSSSDYDRAARWSPSFLEGFNSNMSPMYPPTRDRRMSTPIQHISPYEAKAFKN